jgi:hypothetical protein
MKTKYILLGYVIRWLAMDSFQMFNEGTGITATYLYSSSAHTFLSMATVRKNLKLT